MRDRVRTRGREQRGAAALEFALVVPILLLLVFGAIQWGMYFWASQAGSDITRSAARAAAVGLPASCEEFEAQVREEIEALTGDDAAAAVITRTYDLVGPEVAVGDIVTVAVRFPTHDLGLPMVPFVDDGMVSSTAQVRVDFVPSQPQACL